MAKVHLLGIWKDFGEAPSIEVAIFLPRWLWWIGWLLKNYIWVGAYKAENKAKVIAKIYENKKKYSK